MRRLALIGKNITHSKSPDIYRELLGEEVDYTLLDIDDARKIPKAAQLFKSFDGISVTAPYKRHFLGEVEVCGDFANVNCLRDNHGVVEGVNTDYPAIVNGVRDLKRELGEFWVVLLGDGSMSSMTQDILRKEGIGFEVLSRRKKNLTEDTDLSGLGGKGRPVVVNACRRDYVFVGLLPFGCVFWDYNYNFPPHASRIGQMCDYRDGMGLLRCQAQYSLAFWDGH